MAQTRIEFARRRRRAWRIALLPATLTLAVLQAGGALAQGAAPPLPQPALSSGAKFVQTTGKDLFTNICQGCHMPDGTGASGAGTYPSLAGNAKLESSGYPVYVVVNGQRAMPPFGAMLSDAQVAAVVNYVRTSFGNDFKDAVTPEEVKVVRP